MRFTTLALKRAILIGGDIFIFYTAFVLSLIIRYGAHWQEAITSHFVPFSVVLAGGLLVFYAMRLYDVVAGHGPTLWLQSTVTALTLHFVIAVFFFYFFTRLFTSIAPRGTLFLFFLVFSALFLPWRRFAREFTQKQFQEPTLILGGSKAAAALAEWLQYHPEVGHRVHAVLSEHELSAPKLRSLLQHETVSTIIASPNSLERIAPHLITLPDLKINFWDLASFYEARLEKIPLEYVNDAWVLQHVIRRETPLGEVLKSLFDRVSAGIILLISLPLWPIVAVGVKLSSTGPMFYAHERVGKRGKKFVLRKFRSMYQNAEEAGPRWAEANDPRITPFGRLIRKTHMDELPQLLAILKGDLSFVGPRPERPEFVAKLKKRIPYYDVRHLIKPGFTGWAQLNYAYGSSVEDAAEKLQYDLYYLKHRSLLLDLSIVLKTIRLFFQNPSKL